MKILSLVLGDYQTNCYILHDGSSKDAIVIDPGFEGERVLALLAQHDLNVKYIVATHGHGDHIGAIPTLKKAFPQAQLLIHSLDSHRLTDARSSLIYLMGSQTTMVADGFLAEGDSICAGKINLKVLFTPGHTEGGISLFAQERGDGSLSPVVFVGDTLFQGSVGRTDLPGGNFADLEKSIRQQLYSLPDQTKVYPGHGLPTRIGEEKQTNAYVRVVDTTKDEIHG